MYSLLDCNKYVKNSFLYPESTVYLCFEALENDLILKKIGKSRIIKSLYKKYFFIILKRNVLKPDNR